MWTSYCVKLSHNTYMHMAINLVMIMKPYSDIAPVYLALILTQGQLVLCQERKVSKLLCEICLGLA